MKTWLPCAICGVENTTSKRFRTTFDEVDLSLAICRNCGHCYQCPRLSKAHAQRFYDEAYGENRSKYEYFHPEKKLAHARELFDVFRGRCPDAGRILEIGAGAGEFAHVAQEAGCTVVGTETSRAGIDRAKERYGIELYEDRVQDLDLEPFDAVVMWDVIEHCPEPAEMFAGVSAKLREGGKLILTTGNYECAERLAGGPKWWCWQGDHYHYFCPRGLRQLGQRFDLHDFKFGPVPRLKQTEAAARAAAVRPNTFRFLNPWHVAKVVRYRVLQLAARVLWPDRWNMAVGLFEMTKREATPSPVK